MKKIFLGVFVVVFVGLGVVLIKSKNNKIANEPTATKTKIAIKLIGTQKTTMEQKRDFLGEIYPKHKADIFSKTVGIITFLKPEGSGVKKGEVVALIDDRELKHQINSIEESLQATKYNIQSLQISLEGYQSELEYVQSKVARDTKLFNSKTIAKDTLDRVLLEFQTIKAKNNAHELLIKAKQNELSALEQNLKAKRQEQKYFTIVSPIDGKIDRVYSQIGELSNPAKAILNILSSQKVVRFLIPLDFEAKVGDTIKLDNTQGKILNIFQSTKSYLLECEASITTDATIGELKKVYLSSKSFDGYKLPKESAVQNSEGDFVYVYNGSSFEKKAVTILVSDSKDMLIKENYQNIANAHASVLSKLTSYKNIEIVQ